MKGTTLLRLAASAAVLMSLTACDGFEIDLSGIDLSGLAALAPAAEPAPAPPPAAPAPIVVTPPPVNYGTLSGVTNNTSSINATVDAIIAAQNACGGCAVSVDIEGNADARGTTADNAALSLVRARDTAALVRAELARRGELGGVTLIPTGAGESNAQASVTACQQHPNSAQCVADRATQITITAQPPSVVVTQPVVVTTPDICWTCFVTPDPVPTVTEPPAPPAPPAPTAPPTTLGTDPAPTFDTPSLAVTAFSWAQQGSDQKIGVKLQPLTCNGGTIAPCGVPTSGIARRGTAGPYIVSSSLSSFSLTAPTGYYAPTQYRVVSTPVGSDIQSTKYAVTRYYNATPSGQKFRTSASGTVTIEWRTWEWNGSSMVVTGTSQQTVAANSPALLPAAFGVLGSNISR